jgi:hypothetical protein
VIERVYGGYVAKDWGLFQVLGIDPGKTTRPGQTVKRSEAHSAPQAY